jgi:hypothetical protein
MNKQVIVGTTVVVGSVIAYGIVRAHISERGLADSVASGEFEQAERFAQLHPLNIHKDLIEFASVGAFLLGLITIAAYAESPAHIVDAVALPPKLPFGFTTA